GVGYIYALRIPEMKISFSELFDIHEQVKTFKKDGYTENELVKRWYKDYGILEHLLFDDKILEININPPAYKTSMRIVHADYQECSSNMYPSEDFLNYLATRMKISTGRPLNRAQPQLDGELEIEGVRARVAAIIEPFSIFGTGYSIRKHREHPWTLPLFMHNNTLNAWFAGLMSLVIAHGRSFVSAGPRGSGKTSLLGSLLLEILPKYRMITIEDTEELPTRAYKKLGYDILPLKVRSALLKEGMEMPFDTGLRTSLRLGDSALIVGEIRSKEATVLYEAMRVGAMSNVVAGTIHSDSPYGVFDRVVNDLGVPRGSFKVTDIIIIQNLIKDPSGLNRQRKVVSVTEVLKEWDDEPVFQDLLLFNPETGNLEPTDFLLKGKSVTLKTILKNTTGYKGYDSILKDLLLRGWAKDFMLRLADGNTDLLEATYVAEANIIFTKLFDKFKPLLDESGESKFKEAYMRGLGEIMKRNPEELIAQEDQ
ncbi:Flp pilus assembly complex ATPase component TadA, partial [Candidatus Woesearchaeota archaeon]|nr:Flp pilus assembly complex ATPase component TadA [Candidatus Woesearchaeota archaeon]